MKSIQEIPLKICLLPLLLFVLSLAASAQSIVGTWKRAGNILEKVDGTKKDMQQLLLKYKPCMAEIKYIFEAGGKHYIQSPKGCGINDSEEDATWKMNGNIITVTANEKRQGPGTANYTLFFTGNTVTFTHVYSPSEKAALHSTAVRISITYQRI